MGLLTKNFHCKIYSKTNSESIFLYFSWKEFLPKLLNVMIEKEEVEHNGSMMTGWEYKSEIVTAICVNDWSDSTVTNIASMFM